MRDQFDISGVFETTEFEIAQVACILIFLLCVDRFRINYSLRLYIRIALPYIYLLFFQQPVLMLNSSIDISAFSVGSVRNVR